MGSKALILVGNRTSPESCQNLLSRQNLSKRFSFSQRVWSIMNKSSTRSPALFFFFLQEASAFPDWKGKKDKMSTKTLSVSKKIGCSSSKSKILLYYLKNCFELRTVLKIIRLNIRSIFCFVFWHCSSLNFLLVFEHGKSEEREYNSVSKIFNVSELSLVETFEEVVGSFANFSLLEQLFFE